MSESTTRLTSATQPVLGYAYSAHRITAGATEPRGATESVVYRGIDSGKTVIHDGTNQYHATRISTDAEEPIFQFKEEDIIVK